jgi:type IV secretion system protein TrbF
MSEPGRGSVVTLPSLASGEAVSPEAEAHYLRARELRANAYLSQARMLWSSRLLVVLLAVTDAALVAALIGLSARSRIVPYVVEVDRSGAPVAVGPADRAPSPTKAVLIYALQLFIRDARTVTADEQVQRHLILDAYAYAEGRAVSLLNDHYRRSSPFARAEKGTVTPQVTSVLALTADQASWQIQWEETSRDPNGSVLGKENWQATATVEIDPPATKEEITANPFGLHVVDFDWIRINR